MYLSITTIVLGEVLLTRSRALLLYWAVWFAAVNLVVLVYEEPTLSRRFGESYERYRREVGRWLPRLRGGASRPPSGQQPNKRMQPTEVAPEKWTLG